MGTEPLERDAGVLVGVVAIRIDLDRRHAQAERLLVLAELVAAEAQVVVQQVRAARRARARAPRRVSAAP